MKLLFKIKKTNLKTTNKIKFEEQILFLHILNISNRKNNEIKKTKQISSLLL